MIRINLLPKEILERRKYERYFPWVAIAAVVIIAVILLIYAVQLIQYSSRAHELQQTQETAQKLQQQAQAFGVFEEKEAQLTERRKTVDLALSGRVPWGRLANDVSLVLPSEVWLNQFAGQQDTANSPLSASGTYTGFPSTLELTARTPDEESNKMDDGYKSIAKTMVRLNSLAMLNNVWLKSAQIGKYTTPNTTQSEIPVPTQDFVVTTGIVVVSSSTTTQTSAAPAPPSTPGQ